MGITVQAVGAIANGVTMMTKAPNNAAAAAYFGCDPTWLAKGIGSPGWDETGSTGRAAAFRKVPVVAIAQLMGDGLYEEVHLPTGSDHGWVEGYGAAMGAYALRIKGDKEHPALRHGQFIVVDPSSSPVTGEYVAVTLNDGRQMVKELVIERPTEVVFATLNGDHRSTVDRADIQAMHPISAIVAASQLRAP